MLIGVWDLVRVEIDGEVQEDYGTVEVDADGNLTHVLRYDWTGSGFAPRAQPEIGVVPTDGGQQSDLTQVWAKEGEVHDVLIDDDRYVVQDYLGARTTLEGEGVVPFGEWRTAERDPTTFEPLFPVDVRLEMER